MKLIKKQEIPDRRIFKFLHQIEPQAPLLVVTLSRPLRSRDFCCGLVSAKVLNKFWFLNDSYSDAFPTARTLFQIYYCYPTDRWMIGFLYFDRSWVNWPFGPCLLQFFQLFVKLRLLNAQLLRNLDSLGSFASCWTIFRSLDL